MTLMTSEICMTSRSAATRGMKFLPEAVEGAMSGVVVGHKADDQCRHFFGELVGQLRSVGKQDLTYAFQFGSCLGDRFRIGPRHQHMHRLPDRRGGAHGFGDRRRERFIVVFGDNKNVHESAPASFSLATSSAAFATLMPALRPGGSTVLITLSRCAISTP